MREEIEQTLAEAKVAVLLISAGIIISCRRGGRPVILPAILSPSRFEHTPLARFQSVNLRYPVSQTMRARCALIPRHYQALSGLRHPGFGRSGQHLPVGWLS